MKKSELNVAVLGAGSVGCYLGGQLAGAGALVQFVGRERFKQALDQNGLNLTHYLRAPIIIPRDKFQFNLNLDTASPIDIVLVTVKSQDTEEAGTLLAKSLSKDTLIISFQNGVGNADRLRKVMAGFKVLTGMVPFNVTSKKAGYFHCGTEGDLILERDDTNLSRQLAACFDKAGQACLVSDDIKAVQWGKLLVNLNNGMNTLSGVPLKTGLVQRDYRKAMALMIEEALSVVQKVGIVPAKFGKSSAQSMIKILRLPNFLYQPIMDRVLKIDETARSSMLDDLELGRTSEIDYLQGEIVRLAASSGQKAPINQIILERVHEAFRQGVSPMMTGSEILAVIRNAQ